MIQRLVYQRGDISKLASSYAFAVLSELQDTIGHNLISEKVKVRVILRKAFSGLGSFVPGLGLKALSNGMGRGKAG